MKMKFEEPLEESAPIAARLAESCCDRRNPEESCLLYHSAWQYFRLIGLISTIATDDDFLLPRLESLARTGKHDRVLISGSADYGMLARVIHAWRRAGREPDITLVDLCRTPLELNRWLAQRERVQLNTVQGDIRNYECDRPFDLVCTHSFIGQFKDQRRVLTAAWRNLLRPGGRIVTSARVRPGCTGVVRFGADEVEAFATRARQLATASPSLDAPMAARVTESARRYAERKQRFPVASLEELRAYFEDSGLHIETVDVASGAGDQPSGPSQGGRGQRVRLVVRK